MTTKKIPKKKIFSKFKIASGLFLLLVLGFSIIGIQNRLSTSGKATSGCSIVQTDQGPGCWCNDGGWQFHFGNGLVRNDPPSAECQNDCNNLNGNPPDEDNTPTCPTKGDFRCKAGYIWTCNNNNQWEKGTRSCDSNSCYPGNPTSRGCVDKSRGQKCLDNPPGYCTKTTNKNGFILCSCYTGPSPTIIKSPTPSPRGSATSTPRPSSHPTNTPVPTPTTKPLPKLQTPEVSCSIANDPDALGRGFVTWEWNTIMGAQYYNVTVAKIGSGSYSISTYDTKYVGSGPNGTYVAKVKAVGAGYVTSDYGLKECVLWVQ